LSLIDGAGALDAKLVESWAAMLRPQGFRPIPVADDKLEGNASGPASASPTVRHAVELVRQSRGGTLARPFRPVSRWVVLADVAVEVHPQQRAIHSFVPYYSLPRGDQFLVCGLAGAATHARRLLAAGTTLVEVGTNSPAERMSGAEEDFLVPEAGSLALRLLCVRGFGPWKLEHGLAGSLVVPAGDPMLEDQELRAELRAAVSAALAELRDGVGTSQGDPMVEEDPDVEDEDPAAETIPSFDPDAPRELGTAGGDGLTFG
jgi:hypothetical protein